MVTTTIKADNITHVFTSDKEFLRLGEWVLSNKGKETFDAWELRDAAGERNEEHLALYNEWIADQGITHTWSEE
jgi:hypothetical protein